MPGDPRGPDAPRRPRGRQGDRRGGQARERGRPLTCYVAVIGSGRATAEQAELARQVGRGLAEGGAVIVCGGLGGVMESACAGAQAVGGTTVGLLPGSERAAANPFLSVALPTGLGELRNGLIVRAADVAVAIGRGYGTLSEIAFALKSGTPVVGLGTWDIEGVEQLAGPAEAVARLLTLGSCPRSSPPT